MDLPEKIRVLLADDHVLFNDGLRLQLGHPDSRIDVVEQVFRGDDVLPAVLRHHPDLVLLDINLPQQTGIECARQLVSSFPAVRIIMLTMYAYRKFIDECRTIGVSGYLLKHERASVLINTIQGVYRGETYFPERPTTARHEDDVFIRQFKITPTELKIIRLIYLGLSSQQMAGQLSISFETVRSHRKNIYRKLAITHLSELLLFARDHGLAGPMPS